MLTDHPIIIPLMSIPTLKVEKIMSKLGFIYLIDGGNGLFKIGKAKDPYARFKDLQVGSPVKLNLLHQIDSIQPNRVEYQLHKYFDKQRNHGEWFKLTKEQVDKLIAIEPFQLDYLGFDRFIAYMQNL